MILGLGSNLGDRSVFLKRAIAELEQFLKNMRVSKTYESAAWLTSESPRSWNRPYLNLAVSGETTLLPRELLHELKAIEHKLGRSAKARWAPREIDIDILAWDEQVINEQDLTVPHPSLLQRPFALRPLADLAPGWRYPVTGTCQGQSAARLATGFLLSLAHDPTLVGIINITPDSFSDGGQLSSPEVLTTRIHELIADGAGVLDLGAESTRPGATPLSAEVEWSRLHPALEILKDTVRTLANPPKISIDTRHAAVATKALEAGVDWINDVSGFSDPRMCEVVAGASCDLVMMHSLTVPTDRGVVLPINENCVETLLAWAFDRLEKLEYFGIDRERIIFDPGVGFGKTAAQSIEIICDLDRFKELETRTLIGHSRKSFLTRFTNKPSQDRDFETVIASLEIARHGVDYLRVHDVKSHTRAFSISRTLCREPL